MDLFACESKYAPPMWISLRGVSEEPQEICFTSPTLVRTDMLFGPELITARQSSANNEISTHSPVLKKWLLRQRGAVNRVIL